MGVHDILLNGNSVYKYLSMITVFLKNKISIIIYIDISMYVDTYENNIILRIGQVVQQCNLCILQSSRIVFTLVEAEQFSCLSLCGIHSCHSNSVNMEFGVMKQ